LETEMRIGKTSYADASGGVWMGLEGTDAKMNIGNADSYMQWDGQTLKISGEMDAVKFRAAKRTVISEVNSSYGPPVASLFVAGVFGSGGATYSEIPLGVFFLPASLVEDDRKKITSFQSTLDVSGMISFKN